MKAALRYSKSVAETATPERLMVLLFEAALRHMRRGAAAIESGDRATANQALCKATDIVVELHATLDRPRAPQLCDQLAAIYRFVCVKLASGNLAQNAALIREAEKVFAPIVEAFGLAVNSLSKEETR